MAGSPTPPPVDPALAVRALIERDHPLKMKTASWARELVAEADMIERDRRSVFSREAWKTCAQRGVLASSVPVDQGGAGDDPVTVALKLEGLGLGCRDTGLAYAVASHMLAFQDALVRFADAEQRRAVLEPAIRGDLIGAFAITEPEAGSDSFSMRARATRDGDGWRLSGLKRHITLGPVADVALVFAVTDPDVGRWGLSAFLVWADRPGVEFHPNREKMGLRTTPFGDIELDGYLAEPGDLVGAEGAGASIFSTCMESERGLIMATHLGAAERLIDDAVRYANSREQYGQPIAAFQAISHRIADMVLRHEVARLLLYKAALSIGDGGRATLAAAMAKLGASEAIAELSLDAARIHGARGYVTEDGVERQVRDALGGFVYSGTSDIQKNLIAGLTGVVTTGPRPGGS